MKQSRFESIHSGDFQEKIILKRADALVAVASAGLPDAVAKLMEDIAGSCQKQVQLFVMDRDKDRDLCNLYGVQVSPALLFFRKGTLVDRLSGFVHRTTLSAKIHMHLSHK